jgi:hypothetical protein
MARIMLEPGPLTSEPRLRRVYGSGQVTCA